LAESRKKIAEDGGEVEKVEAMNIVGGRRFLDMH
jgi:hypothetical protein